MTEYAHESRGEQAAASGSGGGTSETPAHRPPAGQQHPGVCAHSASRAHSSRAARRAAADGNADRVSGAPVPVFDAVVLAGGAARRLGGADKPGVRVGGRSLLDRVLAACAGAATTVVVGGRRPTARPVVWAREEPPGGGPLAALHAGLRRTTADHVVVLSADLPFLGEPTVRRLLTALDDTAPEPAAAAGTSRATTGGVDGTGAHGGHGERGRRGDRAARGAFGDFGAPADFGTPAGDFGARDDFGERGARDDLGERGRGGSGPRGAHDDLSARGEQGERGDRGGRDGLDGRRDRDGRGERGGWGGGVGVGDVDGAVLVDDRGRDQPLVAAYHGEALRREIALLAAEHGGLTGLPLRLLSAELALARISDPVASFDCDTWDAIAAARSRIREHGHVLDEWITAVKDELGLDLGLDVDTGALLDLTRDVAHGVARPAGPLTTFLVGYAVARQGGGPEAVAEAVRKVTALADRWTEEDRPDSRPDAG